MSTQIFNGNPAIIFIYISDRLAGFAFDLFFSSVIRLGFHNRNSRATLLLNYDCVNVPLQGHIMLCPPPPLPLPTAFYCCFTLYIYIDFFSTY